MSKSDKLTRTGAAASRSECAYKTLDSERRLIDDPIQVRPLTFEARPRDANGPMQTLAELSEVMKDRLG